MALAERLARLMGQRFGGRFELGRQYPPPLYWVPSDTLVSLDAAAALGIRREDDLFGGVVPHAFVATKMITHALPGVASTAPRGWCAAFAERVRQVVLPGFSAFRARDARLAARRLLRGGSVRVKRSGGIGGSGQSVIRDARQLDDELAAIADDGSLADGVVFERNLHDVTTYGVGEVRVGGLHASYVGTQQLTPNNRGDCVYGGSSLTVVRGGIERLLQLEHAPQVDTAIRQARHYHEAAFASFAGMFASRCNYDVAQGLDDAGRWHSGVLEQSWRIGGASGAEIAALQAFRDDAALQVVHASTSEVYGDRPVLPPGAEVHFSGIDEHVGPITKYSRVQPHDHT